MGAELFGLRESARGELLAGDAGREAKVVLDPGAGAGLAAGSVRFQDQHVEPFGGRIHGGGQSRRAGSHDHDIADVRLVDGVVEAEAIGDLPVGRVAQHHRAAADQDGNVGLGHPKAIQQLLYVGVALEVEVGVGVAVAGQEFPGAERPR